MADVKLRIEVNPDKESEFLNSITNDVGTISNASYKTNGSSAFVGLDNVNESGREMLSWANGVLRFTANGYLSNDGVNAGKLVSESEPDMFVWGAVPQSGEYSVKLTFKGTENLKDIIVYGDPIANQFPTEAIIDGKTTIYSDDYRWAINLGEESETHTIEFTKWNRPNYNACLTRIMVMMRYLPIDKKSGLKSVESLTQLSDDANKISYGLIYSSGRVTFLDVGSEFEDYIEDGIINGSVLPIDVSVNGKLLQSHIAMDSDYSSHNKEVNIELGDILSKWDVYRYDGYKYQGEPKNAYEILESVLNSFGYTASEVAIMCSNNIIAGENNDLISVKEYLETMEIQYPYINSGTYRETIDKFCELAQLHVALDDSGGIKFYNARPIETVKAVQNPIIIPAKQQFSAVEKSVVVKNKFTGATINEKSFYIDTKNLSSKAITFYQVDGENVTNKTNEIEAEFKYAPVVESLEGGSQRWYSSLTYEINFNEIYFKNAKIKYTSSWYKPSNGETSNYEWNVDLPKVGESVGSFNNGTSGAFNLGHPLISVKYIDTRNSIQLKMTTWVGGDITTNGTYYYLLNNSLSITADVLVANEETIYAGNDGNKIELKGNELIQKQVGTQISPANIVVNNILEDYKMGITFGTLDVGCADYYTADGNKAIDWSSGEILQKGDVIRIDKDNNGTPALKHKNGEPIVARIISRNFSYLGKPILSVDWEEIKSSKRSFSKDDWATINRLAQQGSARREYSIGDEKTITLADGTQLTLVIVGFEHDDLANGGKAQISLAMKDLLPNTYPMSAGTASKSNNWSNCNVRDVVLPSLFDKLPEDLKSIIKSVNKKVVSNDYEIITTQDKLWLYSQVEITGSTDEWYSQEGQQYEFWAKNKAETGSYNAIKKLDNGNGGAYSWWYRSLILGSSDYATTNAYGGVGSFAGSTYPLGICFGLCI